MTTQAVQLTLYRWAGQWGPFKVNIPCGECSLTVDVINDTLENELAGIPVDIDNREWLTEWWKPLPKGGWHAPIVMVEGKVVSQGHALNRGVLTEAIIAAHVDRAGVSGNHLYGKVDLSALRTREGVLRRSRHRLHVPRRGQGPACALRDDRPGQAHRRTEDADHRPPDLD